MQSQNTPLPPATSGDTVRNESLFEASLFINGALNLLAKELHRQHGYCFEVHAVDQRKVLEPDAQTGCASMRLLETHPDLRAASNRLNVVAIHDAKTLDVWVNHTGKGDEEPVHWDFQQALHSADVAALGKVLEAIHMAIKLYTPTEWVMKTTPAPTSPTSFFSGECVVAIRSVTLMPPSNEYQVELEDGARLTLYTPTEDTLAWKAGDFLHHDGKGSFQNVPKTNVQ